MLRSIALAVCLPLCGCSSLKGTFENRITTTMTGDRAFVTSLYGPLGITAELSPEDAAEIRRMRESARQAEQLMLVMRLEAANQKEPKK